MKAGIITGIIILAILIFALATGNILNVFVGIGGIILMTIAILLYRKWVDMKAGR